MRKFRLVVPTFAVILFVLLGQSIAWAGTYTSASGPGVAGSGNITWKSAYRAEPVSISVRDDACDSNDVYARYISYYNGGSFTTNTRRNSNGCGTYIDWGGLYINDARGINGVKLQVCVDNFGTDSCYVGAYIDNPLR